MMVTALPVNFDSINKVQLNMVDSISFELLDGPHLGYVRSNAEECTYTYMFNPLPLCTAGPFTCILSLIPLQLILGRNM